MSDFDFTIPFSQLPPGFAETLDHVPDTPAPTRAAATVLLLRDGPTGLETLMLRRTRRSGFVPGAWVFAGGRVDRADARPEITGRLTGLTEEAAATRLGLPLDADPAPAAYWVAGLREAFEETGILPARRHGGEAIPGAGEDPQVARVRDLLISQEIDFNEALDRLEAELDAAAVEYVAHWITPVQEPRRYDTRFFAAVVAAERRYLLHEAEMSEGLWLSPSAALDRHAAGGLPMVFPTIRTLESLSSYTSAASAMEAFSGMEIPAILPRLVKTPTGVGLEVP